jgi:hypothetical protein
MVLAAPGPLLTLQTAGLQDGASHCAKILSSMYVSPNSDPSDPDVIIKLDISNAFNVLCRRLTLDVLGGKASWDYACGLKEGDNIETLCTELRNLFFILQGLTHHQISPALLRLLRERT